MGYTSSFFEEVDSLEGVLGGHNRLGRPRPKSEQALNSSLITRHPVQHVVTFSQIVQCLRQVRQIRLWILLCQLAIDLQRFLVFLPSSLHPVLRAVEHPQVVQHHRHVR